MTDLAWSKCIWNDDIIKQQWDICTRNEAATRCLTVEIKKTSEINDDWDHFSCYKSRKDMKDCKMAIYSSIPPPEFWGQICISNAPVSAANSAGFPHVSMSYQVLNSIFCRGRELLCPLTPCTTPSCWQELWDEETHCGQHWLAGILRRSPCGHTYTHTN